jgi:hypothetical protein
VWTPLVTVTVMVVTSTDVLPPVVFATMMFTAPVMIAVAAMIIA